MEPPPTPEAFVKADDRPRRLADQSITIASSSVQAGLLNHYTRVSTHSNVLEAITHTLNPGLHALDEYKSASMPSNVQAAGK